MTNASEIARLVPWSRVLEDVGAEPGRGRTSCLIHRGANPSSFSYSESTGKAHCYGCGWHGDRVDFLQVALGLDFKTALARLASMAGVNLSNLRKPSNLELARAKAHRTTLAAAKQAYGQWLRRRLVALT